MWIIQWKRTLTLGLWVRPDKDVTSMWIPMHCMHFQMSFIEA